MTQFPLNTIATHNPSPPVNTNAGGGNSSPLKRTFSEAFGNMELPPHTRPTTSLSPTSIVMEPPSEVTDADRNLYAENLLKAIREKNLEKVKWYGGQLIARGGDFNDPVNSNDPSLHRRCPHVHVMRYGTLEMIGFIFNHGGRLDIADEFGRTPKLAVLAYRREDDVYNAIKPHIPPRS